MLLDLRIKARLHSWGNMHATSRSQFPPLVSHGLRSRFRFAFTPLHLSYLCRSQSLAVSLFQLCHQAVTRSTPFHIHLLLHLLFLSVSLCLIVFLLSILQSHWSHFFFASRSFNAFSPAPSLLSATPCFPLCSCFSLIRLFFLFRVLSISLFTCGSGSKSKSAPKSLKQEDVCSQFPCQHKLVKCEAGLYLTFPSNFT